MAQSRVGGSAQTGWRLQVLGEPRVVVESASVRLDRKGAALLAFLALEGPTARARLADLLWPDSEGEGARGAMRQLLRRLKVASGVELAAGRDMLTLAEGLTVDVAELRSHVQAGRSAEALALEGVLLAGGEYAELPDFALWLQRMREQLAALWRRAAVAEVERLEKGGQLVPALGLAERLLAAEPTSEEAYRLLMRLHYLLGDRSAALGLYARCREMLRRELDAEPLPETQALARDIERGGTSPVAPRPPVRSALPASVLRPPVLAGRTRAWARLEAAWEAGQIIFIAGEAGMGKSRLARDFAASKGAYICLESRPGDGHVPYASATRHTQRMLAQRPEVLLEPWVRREAARLMPELLQGESPPPPMHDQEDLLRFFRSHLELIRVCCAGLVAQVVDDLQFADPASNALGSFAFSNAFPAHSSGLPVLIACFRPSEMPAHAKGIMAQMVAGGVAAVVEMEPLGVEEVGELLEGLALPGATRHAADLTRYTGGNPLYVVETVKHLLETGGLERPWPERLPPPGKVGPLIQRRLESLSRPALQLVQVATLAGPAFQLELAAEVLEVPLAALGPALVELANAQVLAEEGFTHDLIGEAARGAIPSALEKLLHRRLADALERRKANPAAVAHHWLQGNEPQRAVPHLLAAAQAEEASLRAAEAEALRAQAARLRQASQARA